jgi:galactonate dehydratase
MSANSPQPLGSATEATKTSQSQTTYLPPSELALKYIKGIQGHIPATPHPSLTATSGNPHAIKLIENFYVRPRWLFVRVSALSVLGW